MRYRQTVVTCDKFGTTPSCPKRPMAMKDTKLKSFIKDYSPYLFAFAHDPDDKTKSYSGKFYRGTPGDSSQTFQMFGSGGGGKALAPCVSQIKLSGAGNLSLADQAKLVRLQLDNCTNQYLLHAALYPTQKEQKPETRLFSMEDPNDLSKKISLDSHCQPLRATNDGKQEYLASEYLEVAWKKMLVDPKFRKDPDAPLEPHLPDGVTLQNTDNPNVKLPKPFPEVRLSQIAAIPYEEINDPTHPYSPRWDFKWNERDHYSPLTQAYSNDSKNAVFCAGDKDKKITKVDILSFREKALDFDHKITDRITFNKNCKANSGMQKDPCCLLNTHGSPFVIDWTCDVQPCAACYGMTPENPVCKTNYIATPDRSRVKPPFLAVHPVLRVGAAAGDIDSLASVAGLPTTLPVDQARAILSSQIGFLSTLSPNMTVGQALPLLSSQLGIINQLNGLSNQFTLNQMANITGMQAAIVSRISSTLPFGQLQSSLFAINNIVASLNPNILLQQALYPLSAMSQSLLQYPNALLGDARQSIYTGLSVMNNLPRTVGIPTATQMLNEEIGNLSSVNQTLTVAQAISSGAIRSNAIIGANIPPGMRVGELRQALQSTNAGLSQFQAATGGAQTQLGNYVADARGLAKQLDGLPAELGASDVGHMLNDVRGGVQGLASGGLSDINHISNALNSLSDLRSVQNQLNSQQLSEAYRQVSSTIYGITGSASGALNQINGQINGQLNGALSKITGALPLKDLNQLSLALSSQLSSLTRFTNVPLSKFLPDISKQLNALNKFAGQLSLGSIAGKLGIPGLPQIPGAPCSIGSQSYPILCVWAMPYQRTAKCNPNEFGANNSDAMAMLCRQLRAPVTMMNKLKMRYHNPDDKDNVVLKEGVQEGFWFKDYFKDHMPYPRLWDTGRSIQQSTSTDQDPLDDNGQFTAIVGIGREAAAEGASGSGGTSAAGAAAPASSSAPKHEDERCLFGGWGEDTSVGGATIKIPDPVTSWTEMKLYQSRTLRYFGLSCLGRYDKMFKTGGTEDLALGVAGAEWSRTLQTTCDKDGKNCKTTNRFGKETTTTENNNANAHNQLLNENWPLSWHGYMGAKKDSNRFPDFGGKASNILTGLDKAQEGDIVLLPNGASKDGDKPGLPKIGVVSRVSLDSNCAKDKNCYVEVKEGDNGKWPDVCGTTSSFGEVKTRTLYRPGALADNVKDELVTRVKWTTDCADPGISACEMANWDTVKLYRIREDVRKGCDKAKSSECKESGS